MSLNNFDYLLLGLVAMLATASFYITFVLTPRLKGPKS